MRRPRIHNVFGNDRVGAGLSTIFTENVRQWSRLVHTSHLPGLFYMTSGPLPVNPVAILSSDRMRELLGELERVFDYVVLDAPPIIGLPDALVLSDLADGTVLVVEDSRVNREELRESLRLAGSSRRALLLGVVLNKIRPSSGWFGYKYSDYYYRGAYK